MSVPAPSYDSLHALYAAAGQEHVFTFFDALDPVEQAALLSQLSSLIDPARVNAIYQLAVSHDSGAGAAGSTSSPDEIAPPPAELVDTPIDNPEAEAAWGELGMQAIREGKVGVILLAGGQGTRLGSTDPKGCYDIGLPSGKSLFQLQAERIRRMSALAGGQVKIPWYIMTSGPTRDATEAYFKQHDYFGLDKRDVIFFNQGGCSVLSSSLVASTDSASFPSCPHCRRPPVPHQRRQDLPRHEILSSRSSRRERWNLLCLTRLLHPLGHAFPRDPVPLHLLRRQLSCPSSRSCFLRLLHW